MKKVAVITGVAGMDGSFLSDLYLEHGYKVYGVVMPCARGTDLGNSSHLVSHPDFEVVEADITDPVAMNNLCRSARPNHFLHMAALSHVGQSFSQPITTYNVNIMGTLNCLEAIRQSGIHTRFLFGATSEMYGGVVSNQKNNEEHKFHPRSPYGVSKVAAYYTVMNYRETYKMFACSTICHNHECFSLDTPVMIKKDNEIQIVYVSDLIPYRTNTDHDNNYLEKNYINSNIEIWDGNKWADLKTVSRKKINLLQEENREQNFYNARRGSVRITPNHKLFLKDNPSKIEAKRINIGDELEIGKFPKRDCNKTLINKNMALILGMLAGDGYISEQCISLANNDPNIINLFKETMKNIFCGLSFGTTTSRSGFDGISTKTSVNGMNNGYTKWVRDILYHKRTKQKMVPMAILNATSDIQNNFLKGYFMTDGLKQGREAYEFSSFKTESPLLAQGILFLINQTTGQTFNINTFIQKNKTYHQINLHSPNNPHNFGSNKIRNPYELKKITSQQEKDNISKHVFNIETSTGKVMAGIGNLVVGNSHRRGTTFVTRKITDAVAKIKFGLQDKLYLGNLDACRDWGDAEDYTKAMKLILDSNEPDDFVLATGETHSVREFCKFAFDHAGLGDYQQYVEIDPRFYRPCEVNVLIGDYSKIKNKLGWEPTTKFSDLVKKMVDYDISLISNKQSSKK